MPLPSLDAFTHALLNAPMADDTVRAAASARNDVLTKPPSALGRLEELAIWFASWSGTDRPVLAAPQVSIFAGNHGVAAKRVSAFPPEVTAQMCMNFGAGGAAINQLARTFGAKLSIHPIALDTPTQDFSEAPAMTEAELIDALSVGWDAVKETSDLLVVGEMGIGNTTSAAALSAAFWGGSGIDWAGRGTGIDDPALTRKRDVIDAGLARHDCASADALEILRCLGGHELAAMAGAVGRARVLGIPVILDGFICCASVSALVRISPTALDHCVAGHVSAEPGHAKLLAHLEMDPILNLGLRLGEGTGAALAIGVLQGAVACHSGMATFDEAAVASR